MRVPGVRAARRAVAGSPAAAARGGPRRPRHRTRAPRRPSPGPPLAGARRGLRPVRPHRPARHHRHRGPYVRPPRRLRRGLRRLGRPARGGRPRHGPRAHRHGRTRCAADRRRRSHQADRRRGPRAAARGRARAGRPHPDRGRRPQVGRRRRRHVHRHAEHQLHQRLLHRLPLLRLRPAAHRRRRLHALPGPGRRPRPTGLGGGRGGGLHAGRHPSRPARDGVLRHREGRQGARARHACARLLADGGRQRRDPHRPVHPRVADGGQGGQASTPYPAPRPRSSTTRSAGSSPRASCRRPPGSR